MKLAQVRLLLSLFLGAVSLPCTAQSVPPIVAQVSQQLVPAQVIRGEFEQRKTIKGFKNPLVSRGDFFVARSRGVVWHAREPFESWLVVTKDRILSRQADGRIDSEVAARGEPALRAVNEMMFALIMADLQALSQRFRIDGELLGSDGWRLTLVPRDLAVAGWITRIELEGAAYVRNVKLDEAQGDSTSIRFTKQVAAPSLTRDEAARFD